MKRLRFLLILMLIIMTMNATIHAASIVTDGLVSYWTFDRDDIIGGTIKDIWGENDATIMGNPTIISGHEKDALKFDGIGDFVNLTSLGDFGTQLGASTFEAWIKVGLKEERQALFKIIDSECMGWGIVFNSHIERNLIKVYDNQCMGWGIEFNKGIELQLEEMPIDEIERLIPSARISFYFSRQLKIIENGIGCRAEAFGTKSLTADREWHHIIYTNRTMKTVRDSRLYVDGELWTQRSFLSEGNIYLPFTAPVFLGAASNRGIPTHFFEGTIDEVRIYITIVHLDQLKLLAILNPEPV